MNLQHANSPAEKVLGQDAASAFRSPMRVAAADAPFDPAHFAWSDASSTRVSRFGLERYLDACNPSCSG